VEDEEAAIEELAHLDGEPGRRAPAGQLQPAGADAHRIVARHHAPIAAAQHVGQIARRPAPDGLGESGGPAETAIEVGDKRRQVRRGRFDGGDAAQAEFTHEAVLQRGPQALDAALGLRRVGGDVADAQLLEHAPQVSGELGAGQLFGERPVRVVADEEVEAVAIERQRPPVAGEQLLKEAGVAVDVLGGPELQGEDLAGGIIDGAQEHELRAARLEPGERAAVDLDEGPAGGLGDSPAPRPRRPPPMAGRQPQLVPHPAHGLPADPQAVLLLQLLCEVAVVEADVKGGHQAYGGLLRRGR